MALLQDVKIGEMRVNKLRAKGVDGTVAWQNIDFTVGTESEDVVNVLVQLKDGNDNDCEEAVSVMAYVSDTAGGAVAASAPDGGAAIGTEGTKIDTFTANKSYLFKTNSTGAFDVDVTESGTDTFYFNVVNPLTGEIESSAVLTFTA
jgi:hypothetical protein